MINPHRILGQVRTLTADLIGISLCNDQKFPVLTVKPGNLIDVNFGSDSNIALVLKNRPYKEIYDELDRTRAYNFKMIDGAILQIMYRFHDARLVSHRLAFFPSPYLEEFQNNPEIYEDDEIYADIIMKSIVPFPIRFDFDNREGVVMPLDHPQSHLSLGQYQNCRIPVTAPITPYRFVCFILGNFYNTAYRKLSNHLSIHNDAFQDTIAPIERSIIHIHLPLQAQ